MSTPETRERDPLRVPDPVPGVPTFVPVFHEGVPSRSLVRSQNSGSVPRSRSLQGNGERRAGGNRLGRKVHLTRHQGCQEPVLVGLDADRCALTATVDPYPITALGEVEALRAGRRTYRLLDGELDRRDRWSIPGHPPAHDLVVLASHDCTGIPESWRMPPPPPAVRPRPEEF